MLSVDNTVHRQHTQAQSSYFLWPFFLTCRRTSTCGLREGCCCWRADSTCHRLWHPDREVLCVLEGIYRGDRAALKREKKKDETVGIWMGGRSLKWKVQQQKFDWRWLGKKCAPKLCVSDGQCFEWVKFLIFKRNCFHFSLFISRCFFMKKTKHEPLQAEIKYYSW